ncbi:hypothetical protein M0802_000729 [Mischocyttarus mexicanus]|nr:hypothetical protein M0802_000729 [Mischocyttarus mexicanus]
MLIVERIILMAFALLLFALANSIGEECKVNNKHVTCHCDGNEEFYLPIGYNYKNVTNLNVSSCSRATLLHNSLTENVEELVVKNISELLNFEIYLYMDKFKRFELTNIKRIPFINHDTFLSIKSIEHFEIRNVHIDYFEEQFWKINVNHFVMANVTILNMEGFNLSEQKGETLQISDCEFRNVSTSSLNFGNFSKVKIVNSKFEFKKPGLLSINSDVAIVHDNIFFNVSINLVATKNITINNICVDGNIESFNNKLPNDITYKSGQTLNVVSKNNTNCTAGSFLKSNGQNANRPITVVFLFEIILLLITC